MVIKYIKQYILFSDKKLSVLFNKIQIIFILNCSFFRKTNVCTFIQFCFIKLFSNHVIKLFLFLNQC